MRIMRTLPFAAILSCCISFSVSAGEIPPSPEWDTVLDGIYSQTWRDRADLNAELAREEARIKQNLSVYLTAWEQRITAPIVYTGADRTGESCTPLNYCAADFLDPQKLLTKLREKKDPVARFLFDKFSPDARKIIAGVEEAKGSPPEKAATGADAGGMPQAGTAAAKVQPEKTVQVLADELTRIVREETIYDRERFAGIPLSPAALALATEHNNPQYRVCTNKTLLVEAFPAVLAHNFKCVIQKDETYRRVVAAKTVQYLRTGDRKPLDEGVALGDTFANKLMYTDFAFWYYYPRALADIQSKDPDALTRDAYALLNNVVLWRESLESGKPSPADMEQRHYLWNLADLILTKGIVEGKIAGLEPLGSVVWLLGDRNETLAPSEPEMKLLRLIVDVRKYLTGPESDNFRLNYAVAMLEGQKRRALLTQMLNTSQKGAYVEKLFNEARAYQLLAYEWAETGQGKATAVTNYLELVNTALARMKDTLPQAAFDSLVTTPDKINTEVAVAVYRGMAEKEEGGWDQLRFIDRKGYISCAQRLWNALGRNSVLVGEYYLKKMDRDDFQSVMDNAEPAEKTLLGYVNLFDAFATKGPREIIPDSAYFTYAETLKKLSLLKRIVYSYNKNMDLHGQSINYLLRAIAVYPYDDGLTEYALDSKNINTGVINMLPDRVISKVVANPVVAKCLRSTTNYCDREMKQTLEWNIYKVSNNLYNRHDTDRLDEMKSLIKSWKDEKRSAGKSMVKVDNQRSAVLALAEKYSASSGKLASLTAAARQQFATCSASGALCEDQRNARDKLFAAKDEFDKIKTDLLNECSRFNQLIGASPGASGDGTEQDYLSGLVTMANDVYLYQTDQMIDIGMQKKLYDLRTMDNHPMHRIVKSGYLAK
jgi:hypothetical protein